MNSPMDISSNTRVSTVCLFFFLLPVVRRGERERDDGEEKRGRERGRMVKERESVRQQKIKIRALLFPTSRNSTSCVWMTSFLSGTLLRCLIYVNSITKAIRNKSQPHLFLPYTPYPCTSGVYQNSAALPASANIVKCERFLPQSFSLSLHTESLIDHSLSCISKKASS